MRYLLTSSTTTKYWCLNTWWMINSRQLNANNLRLRSRLSFRKATSWISRFRAHTLKKNSIGGKLATTMSTSQSCNLLSTATVDYLGEIPIDRCCLLAEAVVSQLAMATSPWVLLMWPSQSHHEWVVANLAHVRSLLLCWSKTVAHWTSLLTRWLTPI